jgi:uncharacterized iron-regulated protein
MSHTIKLLLFLVMIAANGFGQLNNAHYNIFDGEGRPASLTDILEAARSADVLFLGELHDDAIGHAIQLELFRSAIERFGAKRRITLSLEMFERDVQIVVNEYLAGKITEDHFLRSSRPWNNYKTDYRPLVELAREKRLEVIAANAPRRYVNMVSRLGKDSLRSLSPEARSWFAPLPFAPPSEAYSAKFLALMGQMPVASGGSPHGAILESQNFWDATMAYWISRSLKKNKGSLVVHLNGGFHTEKRLGTVEHLAHYRKKAKAIVVTMRYEADFNTFDRDKHTGLGDFVILTDASQPRSQR